LIGYHHSASSLLLKINLGKKIMKNFAKGQILFIVETFANFDDLPWAKKVMVGKSIVPLIN
jgi:hypothetical protein